MTTTNDDLRQRLEGLTRESDALKAQIEAIKQGSEAFSAPDFLGLAQATLDVMRNDLDRPQPWRGKDITRAVASRLGFDVRLNDVRRDRGELEYEYCLRWVRFALAHRPNNSHPYIQRSVKGDKGDMPEHEWNLQKGRRPWVESELREHLRDYLMSWRADGYSPLVGRANGLGRVDDLIGPVGEESPTEASQPVVTPPASTSADAEQASPAGWPEGWAYDVVGSCQLVLRVVASLTQETPAVDSLAINQRTRNLLGMAPSDRPILNSVRPGQFSGTATGGQGEHGTRVNIARTLLQQMGLLQQDERKMWSLAEGATGSSVVDRQGVGKAIDEIAREQGKEWYKGSAALSCDYRRSVRATARPAVTRSDDAPRTVAGNWSEPMNPRDIAKALADRLGPDGKPFELFVRDLLRRRDDSGEVRLRRGTGEERRGDGGWDVEILVDGRITEIVECKLWNDQIGTAEHKRTGTNPYRSFSGTLADHTTANEGLLVTTGTFSQSVWREAASRGGETSKRLRLWDRDTLVDEMRNVSFCIRDADSDGKLLLDLDALDNIKREAEKINPGSATRATGRTGNVVSQPSVRPRPAPQHTSGDDRKKSSTSIAPSARRPRKEPFTAGRWWGGRIARAVLEELQRAGGEGREYSELLDQVSQRLKVHNTDGLERAPERRESPYEYTFRHAMGALSVAECVIRSGVAPSIPRLGRISVPNQRWWLLDGYSPDRVSEKALSDTADSLLRAKSWPKEAEAPVSADAESYLR